MSFLYDLERYGLSYAFRKRVTNRLKNWLWEHARAKLPWRKWYSTLKKYNINLEIEYGNYVKKYNECYSLQTFLNIDIYNGIWYRISTNDFLFRIKTFLFLHKYTYRNAMVLYPSQMIWVTIWTLVIITIVMGLKRVCKKSENFFIQILYCLLYFIEIILTIFLVLFFTTHFYEMHRNLYLFFTFFLFRLSVILLNKFLDYSNDPDKKFDPAVALTDYYFPAFILLYISNAYLQHYTTMTFIDWTEWVYIPQSDLDNSEMVSRTYNNFWNKYYKYLYPREKPLPPFIWKVGNFKQFNWKKKLIKTRKKKFKTKVDLSIFAVIFDWMNEVHDQIANLNFKPIKTPNHKVRDKYWRFRLNKNRVMQYLTMRLKWNSLKKFCNILKSIRKYEKKKKWYWDISDRLMNKIFKLKLKNKRKWYWNVNTSYKIRVKFKEKLLKHNKKK